MAMALTSELSISIKIRFSAGFSDDSVTRNGICITRPAAHTADTQPEHCDATPTSVHSVYFRHSTNCAPADMQHRNSIGKHQNKQQESGSGNTVDAKLIKQ